MTLPPTKQLQYWGIGIVLFLILMWALGNVLLPFVSGMAIAYFLDPVADRLERAGLSRIMSTGLISISVIFIFVVLLLAVVPQIAEQTVALMEALPAYARRFSDAVTSRFPELMDANSSMRSGLNKVFESISSYGGNLAETVLARAFSVIDAVIFLVVTPVVAFYLLLDWDRMVAVIDSWLPRDHLETIRTLARDVNKVLAGFVRGQTMVCAILGVYYALALALVGLKFGLVVGLIAGVLTFIPYVGSLIGGALSIGLALYQFWDTPTWIAVVAVIFVIGQMVEGNYLTPKLVGSSVGLHPVWLMFALSAFGTLMGFTGMLIAVPVSACIGVFARFGVSQYMDSPLYRGLSAKKTSDDTR